MITNPSNFSDQFKNFIEHIALTIKNGLNGKLSINEQILSDEEKTQVKNNIGLPAEIAALKEVLASKSELSNYLLTTGKAASASTADTAGSASTADTADTAGSATNDSSGNNINATYIKSASVNGRTITFTRGNGTTFTITTQDTVTSNTSNWSVSNGTNGWARDDSTGFTIVWGSANSGGGVWITFARSFSSVLSVAFAAWDTGNYSWGNNLNNTGFSHHSSGNCKYISVGFS